MLFRITSVSTDDNGLLVVEGRRGAHDAVTYCIDPASPVGETWTRALAVRSDYVLIDSDDHPPKVLTPAFDLAVPRRPQLQIADITAPSVVWRPYDGVKIETLNGETYLVVIAKGVVSAKFLRFRVPDRQNHTPHDWWCIEAITNFGARAVAAAWKDGANIALADLVHTVLPPILAGSRVPYADGEPDPFLWRREVVAKRAVEAGQMPYVIADRPTASTRVGELLTDLIPDKMYVVEAVPGERMGAPAILSKVAGKTALVRWLPEEPSTARTYLDQLIHFTDGKKPPKYSYPSDYLINDLCRRPSKSWPLCEGLVRTPVLRADGTILDRPGYDASTKLVYAPSVEFPVIPEAPTAADIERARSIVRTPFAEFPFVGPGDQAAALACLFEQFLRPAINAPRPLYIFDAPARGQGTGKTLVPKIAQTILTGEDPIVHTLSDNSVEAEKQVVSYLRQGLPLIILDNLTVTVRHVVLQQIATTTRYVARLLGGNESPVLAQTPTWALTLNGASTNRDMSRRTVLSTQDAGTSEAWQRRDFVLENVVEWAQARRTQIIAAILTLARGWALAGRPKDPRVHRGTYEQWCHVVGGVLYYAGIHGLDRALAAAEARSEERSDVETLAMLWYYEGGTPKTALELADLGLKNGLFHEARSLKGAVLAKHVAPMLSSASLKNGWRIKRSDRPHNGYHRFMLEVPDETPASLPPLQLPPEL